MLRDVFYYGKKPNVHPREKFAKDLADAREQSTTEHFWIINEFCDYRNFDWDFDFEFLPDHEVWASEHNNVWPSVYQKDSGTWLCSQEDSDTIVYRNDVLPLKRKNEKNENWVLLDLVDETRFDFGWHPDPTDPPYIYKWGCYYHPVQVKSVVEYHVPKATQIKYMDTPVKLLPNYERWVEHIKINHEKFDLSWVPNPTEPAYIYVWGNKYEPAEIKPTLEYIVPGATEIKYMQELIEVLPEWDRWHVIQEIEEKTFDFTWRPDPREPPFIYVFGNELYSGTIMPTVEYRMPGAQDKKYIDNIKPKLKSKPELFDILEDIDKNKFDFSWRPNPTSPSYIYAWGNQWNNAEDKISVQFKVDDATEYKFMQERTVRKPCMKNWEIPKNLDTSTFDFSWEPSPADPPFIYEFGTQWQKTGGPKYIVKDATQTKYIDFQKAISLPDKTKFEVLNDLKIENFDYSWHPDNTEQPYIYVFGNQHYQAEIMPTIQYTVPGAITIKYINTIVAMLGPDKTNWDIPENIDDSGFDYSWKPNPNELPYIYQFGTQWQKTGGPVYMSPSTDTTSPVKYMDIFKAIRKPNKNNWEIITDREIKDFDYSWHPDDTEEPYIYVFGNKFYSAEKMPTIRYVVPNAINIKYINDIVATLASNSSNWKILIPIDEEQFDFSWVPDPDSPPYIYVFGNQWNDAEIEPTVEYHVPGATQIKYVDKVKAKVLPDKKLWNILHDVDESTFDFSWRPNPKDPAFIHVFGNQHYSAEIMPTIEYRTEGAIDYKYHTEIIVNLSQNKKNWIIPDNIIVDDFDFSWVPHPMDQPYIYQFGTQWQKTGGPRYMVSGASDIKYIETQKVIHLPSFKNWVMSDNVEDFDFSWHPDDTMPPYIYQFGTILDDKDGPKYITPDNNGEIVYLQTIKKKTTQRAYVEVKRYYIETTLSDLVNQHPAEIFWALNKNIDYSAFDFDWRPEVIHIAWESAYVHVFGSSESEATHTYFVNAKSYLSGNTNLKFIEDAKLNQTYLSKLFVKPDIFFVDKGNKESLLNFEKLKSIHGNKIQKTRYLNSWVETINRCCNKSTTELFYVLNSELDYSNFEFDFYPNPWQIKMVHVFGTQWSHWGTTFMINKESFPNDTKYVKIIEHLNNLNFVKEKKAIATNCVHDIVLIDHDNTQTNEVLTYLQSKVFGKEIATVKYQNSYLETFKTLLKQLPVKKDHFVYICSSICDYTNFDFSYTVDPFAKDQLHVFPSNNQKFGDTFFVDINKMRELIVDLILLENYNKVNYNQNLKASRYTAPTVVIEEDTHINIGKYLNNFPYTIFVTDDNKDIDFFDNVAMSLWQNDTKNILITSTGATRIIVPKEAKDYVKTQLYDYPYIKKIPRLAISKPLDIVFLSNGEKQADENYEHLLKVTKGLKNRITRVDGVKGRVQAYHAAVNASETPWVFTVFAKLKVSPEFDWNWQPDRLQLPKHYIFQAKNPVNGLIYGHQAMIAYNKKLTLNNYGEGLDFTMDDPHEVVESLSGTAHYNTDPFSTWRTAFREVIKLQWDRTEISSKRLEIWATKAEGEFAQYSLDGARDALEYYTSVNGEFEKLRLSYEWDWLKQFFDSKYKPDL